MAKRRTAATDQPGAGSSEEAGEYFDPASVMPAQTLGETIATRLDEHADQLATDEPREFVAEIRVPVSGKALPTEFGLSPVLNLAPPTATKLRKITAGLVDAQAKLASGQPVRNHADAIVFMLEQAEIVATDRPRPNPPLAPPASS